MYTTDEMTVEEFARTLARSGRPPALPRRFWDDHRWVEAHIAELVQTYSGQWVVVYDEQVVAASPDLAVAEEKARERIGTEEAPTLFVAGEEYVF